MAIVSKLVIRCISQGKGTDYDHIQSPVGPFDGGLVVHDLNFDWIDNVRLIMRYVKGKQQLGGNNKVVKH